MSGRFIAVGDNCVDEYVNLGKRYAGGCSLNFSVYIRQLGGVSEYLSAVGRDEEGQVIRHALEEQGVSFNRLQTLDGNTAVTRIRLENGERLFLGYDEGVLRQLTLGKEDLEYINGFDYLHTSVYGNIEKYLTDLTGSAKIIYDFAGKYDQQRFQDIVSCVDYAFLSYEREDAFIRIVMRDYFGMGAGLVVATLGENGSLAFDGSRFYREPGHSVEVVDTLGAGDSFIAGFMYALSDGEGIQECLQKGAWKAEQTIGSFGAF